jgi:hypothetical protein
MRIAVTEFIAAPAARIFALSQDYSRRLEWDPFLREAVLLGDPATVGVGTRSWCVTWFGLGMESEYVSYDPPHVVAVKMTDHSRILKRFAASWTFRGLDADRTAVTFLYSFQMRGWFQPLTPLAGAFFKYEISRRLRLLKKACESRRRA